MIAGQSNSLGVNKSIKKRSRIDDIKARTRCMACGKQGHWYKDVSSCADIMKAKMAEKKAAAAKGNQTDEDMDVDTEDKKKDGTTAFFHQGGQP